jgi:DNA-binding response OmpR family regulator
LHRRACGCFTFASGSNVKLHAIPADPEELTARIRAIRRRVSGSASPELRFGDVSLDLGGKIATRR